VHNLAQVANWRSLVKTSLELQSCILFQINRLDQRGFWSSLLIWKRGHDCSSKDVFTRLRQFAACAKLCTFTLAMIAAIHFPACSDFYIQTISWASANEIFRKQNIVTLMLINFPLFCQGEYWSPFISISEQGDFKSGD
jgi:hypothetical protein